MESPALRPHAATAGEVVNPRARALGLAAAAGLVLTLLGWLFAPDRLCPNLLLAAFYVLGLGLGGLLFLVFGYVTKAEWSIALRPIPAALSRTMPLGALLILVALAGIPWLYDWASEPLHGAKGEWLSAGPFLVRAVIYLAVWLLFSRLISRASRSLDAQSRGVRLSALFIVLFAATFSLASFDWLMSREAHWFSTVFAVYTFTGMFVTALAAITVIAILLRRGGAFAGILTEDHLHDLGKLTLGFTTFWAYIWFCQYMLIWYADIPEETGYFVTRFEGAWGPLMVLNLVVNWLIPFLVLLPRPAKRKESIMLGVGVLLLAGHWLDLYLMVLPPSMEHGPSFGPWELAPLVGAIALFVLVLGRAFSRSR